MSVLLLLGAMSTPLAVLAADENPGVFSVADTEFDAEGKAVVTVNFQTDIEGYNAFQMEFYLPAGYTIGKNKRGNYVFTFNNDEETGICDGYSVTVGDHTSKDDPFYRLVGLSTLTKGAVFVPCDGWFFKFTVCAPEGVTVTEPITVPVKHIEMATGTDPATAYKNIFPDFSFVINPYDDGGTSGVESVVAGAGNGDVEVFDLRGIKVADSTDGLAPECYIVRLGDVTNKIIVK